MSLTLAHTALLVLHLILQNSSNWCFANSSLYCAVWALVCLDDDAIGIRGNKFGMLQHFLQRTAGRPAALETESWFRQLVRFGGFELGQNDISEFTNTFVEWLGAPAIDLSWARRVQNGAEFETLDQGSNSMPVVLQFDASHDGTSKRSLQDLILTWHQVHGQRAALTRATPVLCLQLDRWYRNEAGSLCRNTCAVDVQADVRFPCFTGANTDCEQVQYVLIAIAAHLGADGAGHCRAALKVRPSVTESLNPFQWLLTEDNVRAEQTWQPPLWLMENMTAAWLVRADCLSLPAYGALPTDDVTGHTTIDMQALLRMLNQIPGIEISQNT